MAAPLPEGTLVLGEKLDLPAAGELAKALLEVRGSSVAVDASAVRQIGALSAQVLASAQATWRSDGAPFRITNPSPEFCEASRWLGLSQLFGTEGLPL